MAPHEIKITFYFPDKITSKISYEAAWIYQENKYIYQNCPSKPYLWCKDDTLKQFGKRLGVTFNDDNNKLAAAGMSVLSKAGVESVMKLGTTLEFC